MASETYLSDYNLSTMKSFSDEIISRLDLTNLTNIQIIYNRNYTEHAQPFFTKIDKPYDLDDTNEDHKWKVHLMFNPTLENYVEILNKIFRHHSELPPFLLKFIPSLPITSIKGFEIFPVNDSRFIQGRREVSIKDMDKLIPLQIPIHDPPNKYVLISSGRSQKYEYEYVFSPIIVFYSKLSEMKQLTSELLKLFPDNETKTYTLANFYPRFNLKLNNMIFFTYDSADVKSNEFRCGGLPYCTQSKSKFKIPIEFDAIRSKCSTQDDKEKCANSTILSDKIANKKLCRWNTETSTCDVNPIKTPELLASIKHGSIKEMYEIIGQEQVYNSFLGTRIKLRSKRFFKKCIGRYQKKRSKIRFYKK